MVYLLTTTHGGQTADYMLETELKHAFLTTYNETILLRKVDVNRQWTLEYSPVILHSRRGRLETGEVSLRQCLYHMALLGDSDSDFGVDTSIQNQVWTERF